MLRKLAAGTSAAFVAAGLAAAPAVASRLPATSSEDSCEDVVPAEPNGLDKSTTPADGSVVEAGDTIEVTLRWDEDVIDSAVLERALDCVQIDGRPAPALSLDRPQVPNEGHLEHSYRIPGRLAPGTEICDQGFVFGPPADVPQRLSSRRVCFTVAPPASRPSLPVPMPPLGAPVPAGPGASGPSPSAPDSGGPGLPPGGGSPGGPGPSAGTPPDLPPPVSPPPVSTGPVPTSSPADQPGPAETGIAPARGPSAEPALPQTGRQSRPLAAAGGANLAAAGLAFIAGARRRQRRRWLSLRVRPR